MRVSQVCARNVVCVASDCTVQEAAETMRERHVGSLVVVDGDVVADLPIGLLTDRDIVVSVVATGVRPDVVTVGDIMSTPLYQVGEQEDLRKAVQRMRQKGVCRLVVTSSGGLLSGILAVDDAVAALSAQLNDLSGVGERE